MLGTLLFGAGCSCILGAAYGLLTYDNGENKICEANELKAFMGDGILCTEHVRFSVKMSNHHLLMLAGTGKGKTRSFIMPNIQNLTNCSLVVFDPAGEAALTCKTDKKVFILAPLSKYSVGFNALENCKSETEVKQLAQTISESRKTSNNRSNGSDQDDWVAYTLQLLKSYMLMNWHTKKYTFGEMVTRLSVMPLFPEPIYEYKYNKNGEIEKDEKGNIIRRIKSVTPSIQEEILNSKIDSAIYEFTSFSKVQGAPTMLSCIREILNSYLEIYLDNDLNKNVLNKKNFDLSILRKEESILYIQIPDGKEKYYAPFISTLLKQMFDKLFSVPDGLQMYCLFDEWINCGYMQDFGNLLTTARKYRISLCCATQNLNQIFTLYGADAAKSYIDAFGTILVSGGFKDSAEYIANLLGETLDKRNSVQQYKKLMTGDDIRRLKEDTMLIICDNKRPVIDKMLALVV